MLHRFHSRFHNHGGGVFTITVGAFSVIVKTVVEPMEHTSEGTCSQPQLSSHDIPTSDWRCPTRRGPAAARRWTWSRSSTPSWVGSGHSARYSIILLISDDQLLQKLADIYKFDFLLFDYSFEDFKDQLRNGVSNNNAR